SPVNVCPIGDYASRVLSRDKRGRLPPAAGDGARQHLIGSRILLSPVHIRRSESQPLHVALARNECCRVASTAADRALDHTASSGAAIPVRPVNVCAVDHERPVSPRPRSQRCQTSAIRSDRTTGAFAAAIPATAPHGAYVTACAAVV